MVLSGFPYPHYIRYRDPVKPIGASSQVSSGPADRRREPARRPLCGSRSATPRRGARTDRDSGRGSTHPESAPGAGLRSRWCPRHGVSTCATSPSSSIHGSPSRCQHESNPPSVFVSHSMNSGIDPLKRPAVLLGVLEVAAGDQLEVGAIDRVGVRGKHPADRHLVGERVTHGRPPADRRRLRGPVAQPGHRRAPQVRCTR